MQVHCLLSCLLEKNDCSLDSKSILSCGLFTVSSLHEVFMANLCVPLSVSMDFGLLTMQLNLQMDYINTSHPNFVGGSKAVEIALQQVKTSRIPLPISRQKVYAPSIHSHCYYRLVGKLL